MTGPVAAPKSLPVLTSQVMFPVVKGVKTDSTIAPPPRKKERFSRANVSGLLDKKKDAIKKLSPHTMLSAKGYRTMAYGVARGTAVQEIRPGPGAGFETGDVDK